MRRLAIIGSRDYPNMGQVRDFVLSLSPDTVVVSGDARGVDTVVKRAAEEAELETVIFCVDKNLVNYADEVVAFWDGSSEGTRSVIELARHVGKPILVIGRRTFSLLTK